MLANLNENFGQYSWQNAEFTYLNILCQQWCKQGFCKNVATKMGFTMEDEHLIKQLSASEKCSLRLIAWDAFWQKMKTSQVKKDNDQ